MHNPTDYEVEIRKAAARFAVEHSIHMDDFIFQFLLDQPSFESKGAAAEHYFENGGESARRFDELVCRFANPPETPIEVLEFASGYGCVSRHLNAMKNKYNILACDIHQQAVDFLHDELGVQSIPSHSVPEKLSLDRRFPVIFALSFFSHMPDRTWGRWLAKLIDLLSDGGILIFTTHGAKTAQNIGGVEFDQSGHWFQPVSEQKDLPVDEYGNALVTPKYVVDKIAATKRGKLLFFQEGLWWRHQDAYIVRKCTI